MLILNAHALYKIYIRIKISVFIFPCSMFYDMIHEIIIRFLVKEKALNFINC